MTKWTDEDLAFLQKALAGEADALVVRRPRPEDYFTQLSALTTAGQSLETRTQDQDPEALMAQVRELVGADLVEQIRGARTAQKEPTAQEPAGPAAAEGTEPVAPSDDGHLADVEPTPPGDAEPGPEAQGPLAEEQRPPSRDRSEAPALDPAQEIELRELLHDLRQLRDEGQDIASAVSILGHIGRLRHMIERIARITSRSSEANAAAEDIALLREMQGLADDERRLRRDLAEAQAKKDLPSAGDLRHRAARLADRAQNERWERAFLPLATALRQSCHALVTDVETARTAIAADLSVYLTRDQQDDRERWVSQLDDLAPMVRDLIPEVPTAGGEPARPADLYSELGHKLLTLCVSKADRLRIEAEQYLNRDPPDVDTARERVDTGVSFAQTRHILDVADAKEKAQALARVDERVAEWENKRERARALYEEAVRISDPGESLGALRLLHRAAALFALEGIEEEKGRWRMVLLGQHESAARAAKNAARSYAQERDYHRARKALSDARAALDSLPPEAGLDVGEIRTWIDQRSEEIEAEHQAWLAFEPALKRLQGARPRVDKEGRLDEEWFESLAAHFDPRDLERFQREWQDLRVRYAGEAGDQASYESALARFRKDPLDEHISELLGNVGMESEALYPRAQRLLRRHHARVALAEARKMLADHRLTREPAAWLSDIDRCVQTVHTNGIEEEDQPLVREAESLLAAAQCLRALQEMTDADVKRGRFGEALARLEEPEEDPSLPRCAGQSALIAEGLRWLRFWLRRQWRDARVQSVADRVLETPEMPYRVRADARLGDMRQAAAHLQELKEHGALTEDGDGALAARVRWAWHRAEAEDVLGPGLAGVNPSDVADRVAGDLSRLESLEAHLAALAQDGGRDDDLDPGALADLYLLVTGHYAFVRPRQEALDRLRSMREEGTRYRTEPIVCAALALRLLEDAEDRKEVDLLAADLEERGRRAQKLARAIEQLADAYATHDRGDLGLAVAMLEEARESLAALAPSVAAGLTEAVERVSAEWRRSLGEALLKVVLDGIDDAKDLRAFELLDKLDRAEKMLGRRGAIIQEARQRLEPKADEAQNALMSAARDVLEGTPDPLDEAIREAQRLQGYLEELVDGGAGQAGSELKDLYRDLGDQLQDWEAAQQAVREAWNGIRSVLEGQWHWNMDGRESPTSDLSKLRKNLDDIRLQDPPPREVAQLQDLVRNLESAVKEISAVFEPFRTKFADDTFQGDGDFEQASGHLDQINQLTEKWEREIQKGIRGKNLPWHLGKFTVVRDEYGTPLWLDGERIPGHAVELTSLIDIRERLEKRRHNCQAWETWTPATVELLEDLDDKLSNAKRTLKSPGGLGQVERLCGEEVPSLLESLEKRERTIPDPPLCQLALHAARDTGDYKLDPEEHSDLGRLWRALGDARRVQVWTAWRSYLSAAIQAARQQIEPSVPDQQGEEQTLGDVCQVQRQELTAIVKEMNQHVRRIAPRLRRNLTKASQQLYSEKLAKATQIDEDDPDVEGHLSRFQEWQSILDQKRR